jgi:hypothetical protein
MGIGHMAKSTQQLPTSIDIQVYDIKRTVILTDAVPKIMELHNLTPRMVQGMGESWGGYPIANVQINNALIKRGIMVNGDETSPNYRGYEFTELGKQLCSQMFKVVKGKPF